MNTKLTLNLNKKTIERANRFAKKKNQSLSEIVISPNVIELSGII